MVEGHQCHRVAAAHRKLLVGHAFKASSPNGRFCEGAAAINNKPLAKIEVHGKNLFYFFRKGLENSSKQLQTPPEVHDIVHVHFGMAGAFKTMAPPGDEPTGTTRLRLESSKLNVIAHLSAMTVIHGDDEYYKAKLETLGPDPLREDAEAERLWASIQKSSKPIGLVLMDQSLVAGLGNIYRAEVLFKARVHPEQPASSVTRSEFDELWKHSVLLLQRGFHSGSIVTVDASDAALMGPPWTRRYVYNHSRCGMCKGPIKTWDMANRTVYACEACQVLRGKANLSKARRDAMASASNAKEFVSHCAAEGADTMTPEKMTVAQLRAALLKFGAQPPAQVRKEVLAGMLQAARSGKAAAGTEYNAGVRVEDEATQEEREAEVRAAPSITATGSSKDSAQSQVHVGQLVGGRRSARVRSATEAAHAAQDPRAQSEAPRTPLRKRQASAAEVTPDSKHAKLHHRMRTLSGGTDDLHVAHVPHSDGSAREGPTQGGCSTHDAGHAAEAGFTVEMVAHMKVPELKSLLKKQQIKFPSRAPKAELLQLLTLNTSCDCAMLGASAAAASGDELPSNEGKGPAREAVEAAVVPGTQGLRDVATAAEAAEEKVLAGENRAVEHVALGDADIAGNLL